jgi:hypothetical protein
VTVRVLAYEARRLRGLRSTWIVLSAVLLCDALVAGVLAHQLAAGPLTLAAALRPVTAAVPLLPLPIAALGAGVLGALSYGHEVRHPGLAASQVSYLRRVRLLGGKLAVIGALSVLLAVVTVLVDTVVTRLALAPGVDAAAVFTPEVLGAGGRLPVALGVFAGTVVAAGGAGVLTASLTRSAAAGILVLCALPVLLEAGLALFLREAGVGRPQVAGEALPFQYGFDQYGFDWVSDGSGAAAGSPLDLTDPVLLGAFAAPAVLLLLASLAVQGWRRSL